MKKTSIDLNGIKSRCFVLLTCLSLAFATTSCNNDDFELNEPEQQKQYTKAELIEQALSQLPKTRANGNMPVVMITKGKTVSIMGKLNKGEQMTVYWGNGQDTPLTESFIHSYSYPDDAPFHVIYFYGSPSAIQHLSVDQNELIFLDVANNENLSFFSCSNNELDTLDLTGCNALKTVIASVNELRSIDISHLEYLELLQLDYNKELTHAEISNHLYLHTLDIGNSGIKNLTLSDNPNLAYLFLEKVDLDTLNGLPVDGSNFNFADLTALKELDVAETKFITSLDISNNPYLSLLNIANSQINWLNISNGAIAIVFANGSKLKNLIYTPNKILNLYNLNIIGTPFEREESLLYTFFTSGLPDRSHSDQKGYLYITTPLQPVITALIPYLEKKNWEVRQ